MLVGQTFLYIYNKRITYNLSDLGDDTVQQNDIFKYLNLR